MCIHLCLCVRVRLPTEARKGYWIPGAKSYNGYPVWVLGPELESFGRAVGALNC